MQYKPHDRHSAMEAHARSLEERHRDESAGHAASTQSLENVRQTHDEEQRLLLAALREETARTRSRRQEVQKVAAALTLDHVRLRAEHQALEQRFTLDVGQLRECNEALSRRLGAQAAHAHEEAQAVSTAADVLMERAAQACFGLQQRAREDAAAAEDRLDTARRKGGQRIQELESQLSSLRRRYAKIVGHRKEEFDDLREDVLKLQRATRAAESQVARSVGLQGRLLDSGETCGDSAQGRVAVAAPLKLVLAKLRTALTQCEAALEGERGEQRTRRENSPEQRAQAAGVGEVAPHLRSWRAAAVRAVRSRNRRRATA